MKKIEIFGLNLSRKQMQAVLGGGYETIDPNGNQGGSGGNCTVLCRASGGGGRHDVPDCSSTTAASACGGDIGNLNGCAC